MFEAFTKKHTPDTAKQVPAATDTWGNLPPPKEEPKPQDDIEDVSDLAVEYTPLELESKPESATARVLAEIQREQAEEARRLEAEDKWRFNDKA